MSARECPYCHGMGSETNVRLLGDPECDYAQIYVDPVRSCLVVRETWSEILHADINFCPVCGRDLRKDQS